MTREFERIAWLRERIASQRADIDRDIDRGVDVGDDAAVWPVPPGRSVVLTVDTLVEDTHFRSGWLDRRQLGARAVEVAASDLAAMGASPVAALLAMVLPGEMDDREFRDLFEGCADAARRQGLAIAGGNLARGPLSLTVTAVGSVVAQRALRRDTARSGDRIFVTGSPGRAGLGRELLLHDRKPQGEIEREAVRCFLEPHARIRELERLAASARLSAAIDLSDGLAPDLGHILEESGPHSEGALAAVLDAAALSVALEGPAKKGRHGARTGPFAKLALDLGIDPCEAVLKGGEDYEVLFCAPANQREAIRDCADDVGLALHEIGHLESRPREEAPSIEIVRLDGSRKTHRPSGFSHFAEEG